MEDVTFVNNQDIAGLDARYRRMMKEVQSSQSSPGSRFNPADFTRLNKMLDSVDSYVAWVQSQPEPDYPESFNQTFTLEPFYPYKDVESEEINDLQRMVERARVELVNSQSARVTARLIDHDEVRVISNIERMRKYLADYVAVATPLDYPASSPEDVPTSDPLGGVSA